MKIIFAILVLVAVTSTGAFAAEKICGSLDFQCAGSGSHPDCEYSITTPQGAEYWVKESAKHLVSSKAQGDTACLAEQDLEQGS